MAELLSTFDVLGAFWMTIKLTVLSALGALIIGTLVAVMRLSPVPLLRGMGTAYVNVVRNTPLTLVIVFCRLGLFVNLGIQVADPMSPTSIADTNFRLGIIGLSFYTASFLRPELLRGLNTVPVGQAEAARSIGLGFVQTLSHVVLPQAFRAAITPLTNVLIALTKNTTVVSVIGVAETAYLMSSMIENRSDQLYLIFAIFAIGFVILTLPLGVGLTSLSRRWAVKR